MRVRLLRYGCVSAGLLGLLFVGEIPAANKLARGDMSPFTGNRTDLVTVHVDMNGSFWNVSGSIFDNGSIVVPNAAPNKGKGKQPCGTSAEDCVCAPSAWVRSVLGTGKQLLMGNEIAYYGSLMYKQSLTWQRLPGKLQVKLYIRGYPMQGIKPGDVSSDAVDALAGSEHSFIIGPEAVPGGTTIRIVER